MSTPRASERFTALPDDYATEDPGRIPIVLIRRPVAS